MIRKHLFAWTAVAALAVGTITPGVLLAQMGGAQRGGQMAGEDGAMHQDPDRAFAVVLLSHARLQRQASELVAQKATDPKVKQLAQDIAADHERISQRVREAAQKEGIEIDPDRLLPRDQAILDYMQQLPANVLERDYVFFEAGATQTKQLFAEWAAKNAQRPAMRQLASEVADKIKQRHETIQQLAKSEVGGRQ